MASGMPEALTCPGRFKEHTRGTVGLDLRWAQLDGGGGVIEVGKRFARSKADLAAPDEIALRQI
jgi:hypothetical protein